VATIIAFVRRVMHTAQPLVPPRLFANRTFTVVNLQTVLLYGPLGAAFFLVAFELQVAAGWSPIKSGLALLPATLMMLLLSASSGSLARRIGPRLQLTVGPPIAALGFLLLARIGPEARWITDVLPGSIVFGLGLVTFVAPLSATVMAAADPDHVSIGSAVNNAIARAAALAMLALLPVVSGLAAASTAADVTHSFRVALVIAAVIAAAAGPLAYFGLRPDVHGQRTTRPVHCAVDGPPLQTDPRRCPLQDVPSEVVSMSE
jgi:MFS family permease